MAKRQGITGTRSRVAIASICAVVGLGLAMPAVSISGSSGDKQVRALTAAQKKAKAKALAKCKKIKSKAKRNACVKKVNSKYAPKPVAGKTWTVDVWDNYYAPDILDVKVNDSIQWVWRETSREGHNVSLWKGPKGVSPFDFESLIMSPEGSRFKRQVKTAGAYTFYCSLHAGMDMQVNARK